jgi:hypothetical protein
MKNDFPTAKRPLEYVAFFHFKLSTAEGPAYVFLAVDAFTEFAYSLGIERDENPETVLKNIYFLTENEDFVRHADNGFTIVLEEHENLSPRIEAIIKPMKGKVLFSKGFNNYLSNPVLKSIRDSMMKELGGS